MKSNRIIAIFLLFCFIIHLSGCYSKKFVSADNLRLEKRDKIISYIEKSDTLNQIMIGSGKYRFNGAYLYMDTLFIKLKFREEKKLNLVEYSIPLSEISSIEIKEYEKKKTTRTIVITTGSVVLVLTIITIYGLVMFFYLLSTIY